MDETEINGEPIYGRQWLPIALLLMVLHKGPTGCDGQYYSRVEV
jgi:hypothetical protein